MKAPVSSVLSASTRLAAAKLNACQSQARALRRSPLPLVAGPSKPLRARAMPASVLRCVAYHTSQPRHTPPPLPQTSCTAGDACIRDGVAGTCTSTFDLLGNLVRYCKIDPQCSTDGCGTCGVCDPNTGCTSKADEQSCTLPVLSQATGRCLAAICFDVRAKKSSGGATSTQQCMFEHQCSTYIVQHTHCHA